MQHKKIPSLRFLLGALALTGLFAAPATGQPNPELVVETCNSCHGTSGMSLGPAIPILAGMSKNYLMGAMLAYKYADEPAAADAIVDNDPELEDVIVFERQPTIMTHIAKAYSVDELKTIASFFAAQKLSRSPQISDPALADGGRRIHTKYCEKCHEDGGRSAEDDVGLLAGQWRLYLSYTLEDFAAGDRAMPKKMKEKMTAMKEDIGDSAIEQLVHYYTSQDMGN